jgi:hypothetical protein
MTPRETVEHIEAWNQRRRMQDEAASRQSALICSVLANINRDAKKRPKPYTPDDFMPQTEAKKAQTPAEQAGALRAMVLMLGGEIR